MILDINTILSLRKFPIQLSQKFKKLFAPNIPSEHLVINFSIIVKLITQVTRQFSTVKTQDDTAATMYYML